MTNNRVLIVISAIASVAIFIIIFMLTKPQPAELERTAIEPLPVETPQTTVAEPITPAITPEPAQEVEPAPIEQPAEPKFTPPPLNQSDAPLKQAMGESEQFAAVVGWLTQDELVRKSVVAVDNLAKGNVIAKYRPLNFSHKQLVVESRDNKLYLDRRNFNRYNLWVDTLTQIEPTTWAQWIDRYQPILDQAFGELGYKDKTFNQQLKAGLDQILAAPVLTTDIELVRPSVYYKYADKEIEKLPGIQKLMIRMGPENTVKLQRFAEALRQQL